MTLPFTFTWVPLVHRSQDCNRYMTLQLSHFLALVMACTFSLFQAGAVIGFFCLRYCVRTGLGAHPASYPLSTACSYSGVKAAGA